jgi:hypothetical protein
MSDLLDRESILELLRQLGERLHARGIEAEIYVVGGTAMVLAYDRTRLTRDVDAVTDMQDEVEHEAREMARGRRNLSPDWFNGRVRPMLPRALDVGRVEAFRSPGISVSVASPRHLLAMKVRAARGERDLEDIVLLCEALGITSARGAISIADEVWGAGMLREESVFLVTEGLLDRGLAP